MKPYPLDHWWRSHYKKPYNSSCHRESSPISQCIDYRAYVDSLMVQFEEQIQQSRKQHVDDQEINDFIKNMPNAEALKSLLD